MPRCTKMITWAALHTMPVPNAVIFGPDNQPGELTYGAVRVLGEEDQLRALHRRLDAFFISQVAELAKSDEGPSKVYSPFPLFLMTCVGIETLGKVFFGRIPNQKDGKPIESPEDIQREGFLMVCNKLHKHFSRPLSKEQKNAHDELWGVGAQKNAQTPSQIIYRLGRHTMVHGYRGRGVFITEGISEWALETGAMLINPYWLWRSFSIVYKDLWERLHSNKEANNPLKKAALLYLHDLLN